MSAVRGLWVCPAGVDVLVVFHDENPALWDGAVEAWASVEPVPVDDVGSVLGDAERVIVLSQESGETVRAELGVDKDAVVISSVDAAYAAERLTVEVTLHLLQTLVGQAQLLHAAVLGDEASGAAVALVASSGTGKTTASRFLGRFLTYLTDETAVIQPDFVVRPYAKPLSVIESGSTYKVQYDPAALGLKVAAPDDGRFSLRAVLVLNRVKDSYVEPVLERLPLADALVQVVEQSSGTQLQDAGLVKVAELLNGVGGALRLTYSEVEETLPLVESVLAGSSGIPELREDVEFIPDVDADLRSAWVAESREAAGSGRGILVSRATTSAGLVLGERVLIATQGRLSEVSIFAWDCWELLDQPKSLDELYESLVGLYGEVPRPEFESTVEELRRAFIVAQG